MHTHQANILHHLENNSLSRQRWGIDAHLCLLSIVAPPCRAEESELACPPATMPVWMAYVTSWISERAPAESWDSSIRGYAHLAEKWHYLSPKYWTRIEHDVQRKLIELCGDPTHPLVQKALEEDVLGTGKQDALRVEALQLQKDPSQNFTVSAVISRVLSPTPSGIGGALYALPGKEEEALAVLFTTIGEAVAPIQAADERMQVFRSLAQTARRKLREATEQSKGLETELAKLRKAVKAAQEKHSKAGKKGESRSEALYAADQAAEKVTRKEKVLAETVARIPGLEEELTQAGKAAQQAEEEYWRVKEA